jgi:dihydroflavonol-4-reductase
MSNSNGSLNILVTGAGGFVGQNLVPRLLNLGHHVRTFARSKALPESLAKLNLEHYCGDITNFNEISQTMNNNNIDLVYHLAGLVSYKKRDYEKIHAVNVIGTRNVMQASLAAGVSRVIHTSSVAAFGIPEPGKIGAEDIEYNLAGLGLTYCDTKHLAEQEVMKCVSSGLSAIILNPGIIFGEGDTHPHHHAIFAAMSKGWMIGVPSGGVTFSDINDVVEAFIHCINKGKIGQRYAVVSANLSFKEAALIFAKLNSLRGPLFEIPNNFLTGLGTVVENVSPLFGIDPPLTRQAAWLSQQKIFFSSAKACADIDFHPTPFIDTVRRTSSYYLSKNKTRHHNNHSG